MASLADMPAEVLGLIFQEVFYHSETEVLCWTNRRRDFRNIASSAKWLDNVIHNTLLQTVSGKRCRYNTGANDFPWVQQADLWKARHNLVCMESSTLCA